jgi:sulfotransferase
METIHFISGLPRSGSSLIADILKQNSQIHSENHSNLAGILNNVNQVWEKIETKGNFDQSKKTGVMSGILSGYYHDITKPIVINNNFQWIPLIKTVEAVFQKKVKIIVPVRNPAEILTSFERFRKDHPLMTLEVDQILKNNSSVAARAFYYAGPEGILGVTHRNIKDAIIMGYIDRLLFVDYNRFCNSPKSQTKRIYEFLGIDHYDHDFDNIEQLNFDSSIVSNRIQKTTVNCVEYLGLDLYEQYNREIFWTAWI